MLTAKAAVGEAGVPFYSASWSVFVERVPPLRDAACESARPHRALADLQCLLDAAFDRPDTLFESLELFVGVGSSRVRDLFTMAKKNGLLMVFIDKVNTIGKSDQEGKGFSGSHERGQTLNQVLIEMGGFGTQRHMVVLGCALIGRDGGVAEGRRRASLGMFCYD